MTSAAYQKKKELTTNHEAVDRLLGFLDTDRAAAERKYERIKEKLTNLFRWRGCPQPREYAAKTIEGAARELLEGARQQVHDPYLYFHRVAINVSNALKEQWAANEKDGFKATPNNVAVAPGVSHENDLNQQRERRVHCLRECLSALSIESLELIAKYHRAGGAHVKESRKELARSLGISQSELRLRVFRIRAGLRRSVNNCVGRSRSSSAGKNGGYFES